MSEHPRGNNDLFRTANASLRNHFGELADKMMEARLKIMQKLVDRIAVETDTDKLAKLRQELSGTVINSADIENLDAVLGRLLEMLKKHTATWLEIQKMMAGGSHDHH